MHNSEGRDLDPPPTHPPRNMQSQLKSAFKIQSFLKYKVFQPFGFILVMGIDQKHLVIFNISFGLHKYAKTFSPVMHK